MGTYFKLQLFLITNYIHISSTFDIQDSSEASLFHPRHHHGGNNQNGVTPLFGLGIGYKKISHYVPVLTLQTRKRKPNKGSDVIIHHSNGVRGSVTIAGDDDGNLDGQLSTTGFQQQQQNDQQNFQQQQSLNNNGVSVQYHNLRSDDARSGRGRNRLILHSDRDEKLEKSYYSRRTNFPREDWEGSESRRSNHGNSYNNGRNDRNKNNRKRNPYDDGNDSDESEEVEMNEYTIGGWDWKPKRGSSDVFGFKKFFRNSPRSYF